MRNQFTVSGNLSKAPETKTFPGKNGKGDNTFVEVSLALNCSDKDAGPLWVDAQCYGKREGEQLLALTKGARVLLQGELAWRNDKRGERRYTLRNAVFAPGWLPPLPGSPPPSASTPVAAQTVDEGLPF
jgi:single-stranded DNA-binding protein